MMTIEFRTNQERERAKGFKFIKEYKDYYLYGKYTPEGTLLYKECFSKFDMDGVKPQEQPRRYYSWRI